MVTRYGRYSVATRTPTGAALFWVGILCYMLLSPALARADVIQGPVTHRVELDLTSSTGAVLELGLEEIAIVTPVGDPRFLSGIEIEVHVPADAREFPGSLALLVLRAISESDASIEADRIEGDRVILQPFPSGARFFTALPTGEGHEFRSSATLEVASGITQASDMPLAISIRPVMKGISRRAAASRVLLTVRPVTRNEGGLAVRFLDTAGEVVAIDDTQLMNTQLLLDDEELKLGSLPAVRQPGLHRVVFRGELWKEQSFTVGIERGTITTAVVRLEPALAKLYLTAPEGTEIFIDGRDFSGTSEAIGLSPGEHTLLFRVGDHTVTRRISVEPNKEYKVSLSLDILVNED